MTLRSWIKGLNNSLIYSVVCVPYIVSRTVYHSQVLSNEKEQWKQHQSHITFFIFNSVINVQTIHDAFSFISHDVFVTYLNLTQITKVYFSGERVIPLYVNQ